MPQRIRKLIGTVLMLLLVVFWALSAMALAQGRVTELGWALQTLCYVLPARCGWCPPPSSSAGWSGRMRSANYAEISDC